MSNISLSYAQLFGSYIVFNYLTHLISLLVFILQFGDIRYYCIYAEKEKFREITKKIEKETYFGAYKHNNGRTSPAGYFIGWQCIGYLDSLERYEDGENIRILTTISFYKKLTEEKSIEATFLTSAETPEKKDAVVSNKIRIYNRYGSYKRFYYDHIRLNLGNITPIGQQAEIIDSISKIYDKRKRMAVFIHGVSYAGKSSIGYLLAKKYNGRFCHSFNPIDPGDQVSFLINTMNSDRESDDTPNIIVLEEVDSIIKAIHTNTVVLNKEVPTLAYDKSTWIRFLDDMVLYTNVILILTSNMSKDAIDALDPAYVYKSRMHASFSMNQPLEINTDD
jgi:hypothetical protein